MSKKYYTDDPNMAEARKAIEGGFWLLVVAIYLIVSFVYGIWMFSWIIFIIAAAIQQIIRAVYLYKRPATSDPKEDSETHEP